MKDTAKLVNYCKEKFNFSNAKLSAEFYYDSLPLAVIDAVFSIQAHYQSVINTVEKYRAKYEAGKEHTISEFIENIINTGGSEKFESTVLKNAQRISGELKATNVYKWAVLLQKNGIETFDDFNKKMNEDIKKELKAVKGQGGGVALDYLYMLCGDDNICKEDTHLLHFLSNALECDVRKGEGQNIMEKAVASLKTEYPQMTVRLLDYIIWSFQSKHKKSKRSCNNVWQTKEGT